MVPTNGAPGPRVGKNVSGALHRDDKTTCGVSARLDSFLNVLAANCQKGTWRIFILSAFGV